MADSSERARDCRVFISYSHQPESDKEWVRLLAELLEGTGGIQVRLDQWYCLPGDRLTHFMEREFADASHVIIVGTPEYAAKADDRTGGVGYEGHFISNEIYIGASDTKFIPLLLRGESHLGSDCGLPRFLCGALYIDFRNHKLNASSDKLWDLIRTIYGKPKYGPPRRSPKPRLDTHSSTDALSSAQSISAGNAEDVGVFEALEHELGMLNAQLAELNGSYNQWLATSITHGWKTGMRFVSQQKMADVSSQVSIVTRDRDRVLRSITEMKKQTESNRVWTSPRDGAKCPFCSGVLHFQGTRLISKDVREIFSCSGVEQHLVFGNALRGLDD